MELTKDVEELLEKSHLQWKKMQPIATSLWGEPDWDAAEDLSVEGLSRLEDAIKGLKNNIEEIRTRSLTSLDHAVLAGLHFMVNDQFFRHVHQRVYQTQSSSYLRLSAFALLPFAIEIETKGKLPKDMAELLENRLHRGLVWLEIAEQRLQAKELAFSETNKRTATWLYQSIGKWTGLPERLRDAWMASLDRLSKMSIQKSNTGIRTSLSMNYYIQEIIGLHYTIDDLLEQLTNRLAQEVEQLTQAISEINKSHGKNTVSPDIPLDILSFGEWVEGELRANSRNLQGPPSIFMRAPNILQPFLEDSMYLPPHFTGRSNDEPGYYIVNTANMKQSMSRTWQAGLALAVAHELCPGHGEHLRSASRSLLAKLHEITRSPLGLEGWAFFSEQAICNIEYLLPDAKYSVHLQRVRRFYVAAFLVAKSRIGEDKAREMMRQLMIPLPPKTQQWIEGIQHRQGWQLLTYALGLLETETALAEIGHLLGKQPCDPDVVDKYLAWGPLAPQSIVKIIKSNL